MFFFRYVSFFNEKIFLFQKCITITLVFANCSFIIFHCFIIFLAQWNIDFGHIRDFNLSIYLTVNGPKSLGSIIRFLESGRSTSRSIRQCVRLQIVLLPSYPKSGWLSWKWNCSAIHSWDSLVTELFIRTQELIKAFYEYPIQVGDKNCYKTAF